LKVPIQLIIVIFAVSAIYIWKFIYKLFFFESDKRKNPLKHYNLEATKVILIIDISAVASVYLDKPCSAQEYLRYKEFLEAIETDRIFKKHATQKEFYDFVVSLGFTMPPFCAPRLLTRKEKLSILKDIKELHRELNLIRRIAIKARNEKLYGSPMRSACNRYLMDRTKKEEQHAQLTPH